MTTRIYYTEPYRVRFEATVERCEMVEGRPHVVLDQTAFYPTSGGQPFDTGTLGGQRVLDVLDLDGGVAHVVDGTLAAGARVDGEIDWSRRFDHMQQHTGQHVLSAAFERLSGVRTESFHLGSAASTIDLAREVSADELRAAEDEANRIVWEDRAVEIRFVTAEEAAAMPLRKEPARGGTLRLIDIGDFDLSACGGTHVSRTGGIGIIAISGWEKFRGGTRVEFLCGGRALQRFRAWRHAFAETMRRLSVAPEELAAAIERLQSENKTLGRTVRTLHEQLAVHEGAAMMGRATRIGSRLVIAEARDGWDAQGLKALAAAAAQQPGAAVALFTPTSPALVVVASHADSGVDAAGVLKSLTARFGGKGGGKRDLAQGGGLTGTAEELTAAARELLATAESV